MNIAANRTPIAIINHEPVIKYINHSKPQVMFYRFTMSCNHSSKCKQEILLTLRTKRQIKNCLDVGNQNGKKNRGKKNVEHHITIIQSHLYHYKLIIHDMWKTQINYI